MRLEQRAANSDLYEAARAPRPGGAGWTGEGLDRARADWMDLGGWRMEPRGLDSTGSLSLPPHIGVQKGHFRYSELIFVPSSSTLFAHSPLGPRGGVAASKSRQKLLTGCCFVVASSGYGFSISCRVMVSR